MDSDKTMENLAIDFYNLLKERFDNNVYITERNVTYTFFATIAVFGYYKHYEILLEYNHPKIKGKKVDTYIQANGKKNGLVMECKYDRKIPSGHNGPRPQKAGKIFNDFFRLASFTNDANVVKWLIYLTDEEMVNYFNNGNNKLNNFFNLATGSTLKIDEKYLKEKSQTFRGEIKTNDISEIIIKCVFQKNLPNNHKIKIYEVKRPHEVDNNQCNIYTSEDIKHKDGASIQKSSPIKQQNILPSQKETVIKNVEFIYDNKKYVALLYKNKGNDCVYGKILLKDNVQQKINMKDIARKYLRPFGINIPTTSNVNTHDSVRKLVDILEQKSRTKGV
jgi:hypothetical protein